MLLEEVLVGGDGVRLACLLEVLARRAACSQRSGHGARGDGETQPAKSVHYDLRLKRAGSAGDRLSSLYATICSGIDAIVQRDFCWARAALRRATDVHRIGEPRPDRRTEVPR